MASLFDDPPFGQDVFGYHSTAEAHPALAQHESAILAELMRQYGLTSRNDFASAYALGDPKNPVVAAMLDSERKLAQHRAMLKNLKESLAARSFQFMRGPVVPYRGPR